MRQLRVLHPAAMRAMLPPARLALLCALVLASCVPVPEPPPPRLVLPPLFTDNMVLQQGMPNLVWGWETPGRPIWVRYKNLTAATKAGRTGRWEVQLDLTMAGPDPHPDYLMIGIGRPGENLTAVLTNVAVGNVWILGVCDGKGLSLQATAYLDNLLARDSHGGRELAAAFSRASPAEAGLIFAGDEQGVPLQVRGNFQWDRERIRFLTLTNLESLCEVSSRVESSWEPCSPEGLDLRRISTFAFNMAFGLGAGYIGVIQTSTNSLAQGSAFPAPVATALSPERDAQVRLGLIGAYAHASAKVHQAQKSREEALYYNRIDNVVADLPKIHEYDFPSIYARAAFSATQPPASLVRPPASLVSFEGAMW